LFSLLTLIAFAHQTNAQDEPKVHNYSFDTAHYSAVKYKLINGTFKLVKEWEDERVLWEFEWDRAGKLKGEDD
ncbi:MAG: hypothetical protein JKY54_17670, partial [Flavobacteriales bacterium]|nr:hypothetical protein [Flavobacteriales bacterium]